MAEKFSLEKSLLRLEEISQQLENADLPLDEALKLFEEGTKLVKKCKERIESAELKVKELTAE